MHDNPTTPSGGLNDFEQRLAALVPDAGKLNHDRLLWQAGYEAALGARTQRRVNRLLAASTATLAAACLLLGVALIFERANSPTMIAAPSEGPAPPDGASPVVTDSEVGEPKDRLLALDQRRTAHESRPHDAAHRLSYLALRRHGFADRIDDAPSASAAVERAPEVPRPIEARQLLEELLGRADVLQ